MTTFDLIDHYQFEYISTLHRGSPKKCGCCSMVEEMNDIKTLYGKSPIKDVLRACVCRRHGHQYCIPNTAVDAAVDALLDSNFVRVDRSVSPFVEGGKLSEVFEDFEELYDFISSVISSISGIGLLTVYDTAKRIGHLFEYPIYPKQYVYLAAGAKKGAEKLLKTKDLRFREPISLFEPSFGSFPSIFIEDMLCIYESLFNGCYANSISGSIIISSGSIVITRKSKKVKII